MKPIIITSKLKYEYQIRCPILFDKEKCLIWKGHLDKDGYGVLQHNGINYFASRIAYMLHHNLIEFNLFALHHCDNPPCINPYHLFAGTQADNIKDMQAKGRMANGDLLPQTKISFEAAKYIRDETAKGKTQQTLANELGVSQSLISLVVNNIIWINNPKPKELTNESPVEQ